MRRVWLIRPPKGGLHDDNAIESGIVTGEFGVREDLSDHIEYDAILQEVEISNPQLKASRIESLARQLDTLLNKMASGDLVVHPHNNRRSIAIGILLPDVVKDRDERPAREVEWLRTDIAKTDIQPDMQYSFSSGLQICELTRNNAVTRVEAMVADGRDPGPELKQTTAASLQDMSSAEIESHMWLRFASQIGSVFAGHDMACLAAALLEIDGYKVKVSMPGPDGGCDLMAGRGSLGFEAPTIAGQVKSGDIIVDDLTLQSLIGVVQSRGADRGLIVAWGGISGVVARELERMPCKFAYWDRREICRRFVEGYDKLPLWVRDRVSIRTAPILCLDAEDTPARKAVDLK
ncbi:restriction endonuclease [Pseudosulfitobacter pseudonitzschiae]|uniref:restriction endonuclease n=1 Tax=Pseudosulfitobacter pseudonitzschiae TaxID=1402135 RepID=UPI003B7FFA31